VSLTTLLLIILIVLLVAAVPTWPYNTGWGYGPSGILGIVLLVVVIYGPVLVGGLADPSAAVQVEGLNYFADTLLFGGTILALARAMPASAPARSG